MHRYLLEDPVMTIDHINHSGIDNRRENLRLVTHAENSQNKRPKKTNSGFRNVVWHKRNGKWQVSMKVCGKQLYFGLYTDIAEANEVAIQARKTHMPFAN